jgi:hypothetical protein
MAQLDEELDESESVDKYLLSVEIVEKESARFSSSIGVNSSMSDFSIIGVGALLHRSSSLEEASSHVVNFNRFTNQINKNIKSSFL